MFCNHFKSIVEIIMGRHTMKFNKGAASAPSTNRTRRREPMGKRRKKTWLSEVGVFWRRGRFEEDEDETDGRGVK